MAGELCVNKNCFEKKKKDFGGLRAGRPNNVPTDLKVSQGEGKQGKANSLKRSTLKPWLKLEAQSYFLQR